MAPPDPPPPRTTPLVPYTTLFRSELPPRSNSLHTRPRISRRVSLRRNGPRRPLVAPENQPREDPKSTRLNSSHSSSSYAVFCLKKKHKLFATELTPSA